jgi:hypothetical protein
VSPSARSKELGWENEGRGTMLSLTVANTKTFRRLSGVILVGLLLGTLCGLRVQYLREMSVVASIASTVEFANAKEGYVLSSVVQIDAVALYRWIGPAAFELPARSIGCPWFDRIVRVDVIDSGRVSPTSLHRLKGLNYLREVDVSECSLQPEYCEQVRQLFVGSHIKVRVPVSTKEVSGTVDKFTPTTRMRDRSAQRGLNGTVDAPDQSTELSK